MKVNIIKPEDFNTSNWTGGTTNQLFIHPSTANYAQRNFDFRLSSAIVHSPYSEFTSLPGISRNLMVLEGQIHLSHKSMMSIPKAPICHPMFAFSNNMRNC